MPMFVAILRRLCDDYIFIVTILRTRTGASMNEAVLAVIEEGNWSTIEKFFRNGATNFHEARELTNLLDKPNIYHRLLTLELELTQSAIRIDCSSQKRRTRCNGERGPSSRKRQNRCSDE